LECKRAVFFVDGFNLYHSIDNNPAFHKYKWLDLAALCRQFLKPSEDAGEIYYFTARPVWNQEKLTRHDMYIEICKSVGCTVILGNFQKMERVSRVQCGQPCLSADAVNSQAFCNKKYQAHEEKKTDVNIAVRIMTACIEQSCDTVYLVSGDNDLVPPLEAVKRLFPKIKISVLSPPHLKTKKLQATCNRNGFNYNVISQGHLQRALLPNVIMIRGHKYHCPAKWR
jgi:uncharacterized LabA/DUF88 family protein